jgi:hypothetical protein
VKEYNVNPTQAANRLRVHRGRHQIYLPAMMVLVGIVAASGNANACENPIAGKHLAVATSAAAIAAAKEAWKSIYSKAPQHSAFRFSYLSWKVGPIRIPRPYIQGSGKLPVVRGGLGSRVACR